MLKKLIIVSGRSGSGKSTALHTLEDLGYYCIDNLPVTLLPEVIDRIQNDMNIDQLALGVDVRTPQADLLQVEAIIEKIAPIVQPEIIYLDARDDVLLKRFSSTRRRHPLLEQYSNLTDALNAEQNILAALKRQSSMIIDTSQLNIHDLNQQLQAKLGDHDGMIVILKSFGFKHGLPLDAELVFDLRHLPNPHWEPSLKSLTGLDKEVQSFFQQKPEFDLMQTDILTFLQKWLPVYAAGHRHAFTVAIGCTGGQHRSVYMVEQLKKALDTNWKVQLQHRELQHWS